MLNGAGTDPDFVWPELFQFVCVWGNLLRKKKIYVSIWTQYYVLMWLLTWNKGKEKMTNL